MKITESEITIIGAGLAGLTASLWLVKNNVPHVILDSKSSPREKACGDIITSKAIRRLNEIGPDLIQDMKSQGILLPIEGNIIYPPNHQSITLNFNNLDGIAGVPSCYSVKRHLLDSYLMNRIQESESAEVFTNSMVEKIERHEDHFIVQTRANKVIKTKLAIIATGSNSNLTNQLSPIKKASMDFAVGIRGYFKNVDTTAGFGEIILDNALMPGGI